MKTKLFLIVTLISFGMIFSSFQEGTELNAGKASQWTALQEKGGDLSDISDKIEISNYPDPFIDETNIVYTLNKSTFARLYVHEMSSGKKVLLFEGFQSAGKHVFTFNAEDQEPGEYIAELVTNYATAKEVMIKVHNWGGSSTK